MRFDQVRREFKRTLWGEELDNESYASTCAPFFDLSFLHEYDGKKYRCYLCKKEFEEYKLLFSENGRACLACVKNSSSDNPNK